MKKQITMNKEFIPYEQAFELKSLGFNERCFDRWYQLENGAFELFKNINEDKDILMFPFIIVEAPIYQQVFRWFRDDHNIDAWVQPLLAVNSKDELFLPDESYSYCIFRDGEFVSNETDFNEPEDAELACLRKLIELVKNK